MPSRLPDRFLPVVLVGCLAATVAARAIAAEEDLSRYAIFAKTAPRAEACPAGTTALPLELRRGDRICLIGNTLFERAQLFGQVAAAFHAGFPDHELVIRTLAWSADEVDLAPRPENFADVEQHLAHLRADVILAAYGFNESFAGAEGLPAFREKLAAFLRSLASKAFNGKTAARIVLVSPIPNENVAGVAAADLNNARIGAYVAAMREIARQEGVAFVDVFEPMLTAVADPAGDLTINGCHLSKEGYGLFAKTLYRACFAADPPAVDERLRTAVVDLDRQFFRRYRPLNTFYYTGGRNKEYGYLDFLPAMRNFDIMCANRDRRIWDIAHGRPVADRPDDSNLPDMPPVNETRGANEWLPAEKEREAFQVDPRFEVGLFAGEEQFPEIANPIQCRWDSRGRLWVSTSQAYPHVYPGMEPRDRLVILEDTDGDGKADTSKVFADDLHLPLSFEFGDGGVYVSEQPNLTFLRDTDGDDRADVHEVILSGFGTEDSHHSLHDFVWTPDGGLLFRESIFHHSQVETPHGPVRQRDSGWFRYEPRTHRLASFGTYMSTNPWGVCFDPWGNHLASHPIFAEAFHSLDPPYPKQFPTPQGLQAYSGVCGQAFVDTPGFPAAMHGGFVKNRYKPTNRIEIHDWVEGPDGFNERYVGDLLFSTNLSFIPVDLHFGPRGDLYCVDWYNPVKGHAQYSLRDTRRDRESGRIWRIVAKGQELPPAPTIAGASERDLASLLGHREFRVRYLATRELAARDRSAAAAAIDAWVAALDRASPRLLRDTTEAMWAASTIGVPRPALLLELFAAGDHHARAAAVRQLRFWHESLPDRHELLGRAARDPSGLVRLEAAITATWIGTPEALAAILEVCRQPMTGHLAYAATCGLESRAIARHWQDDPSSPVPAILKKAARSLKITEPKPTAEERGFDQRAGVAEVRISCEPERMLFTLREFTAKPGQPVKLVFTNPDATDHNLVIVKPGALAEVGMAANDMAKDPKNATSDFLPESKRDLIVAATPMIGPTRKALAHALRFEAPSEPGVYPFVCTFPGHWIVMNGRMVVAQDPAQAEELLAACRPQIVKAWTLEDFPEVSPSADEATLAAGMHAFVKAQCTQCHVAAGHGVNLGPGLAETAKKYRGRELLEQVLDPSKSIHEKYRTMQFVLASGKVVSGVVVGETPDAYRIVPNLLAPDRVTTVKRDDVEEATPSKVSAMPAGLLNMLARDEILALVAFLQAGENLPPSLRHDASHGGAAGEPRVRVVAGSAAGRTKTAADAAVVNEPFAVAFDAKGRMYGVEYTRGNRLFRVDDPSGAATPAAVTFVAGGFHQPKKGEPVPSEQAPDAAGAVEAAGAVFHGLHDVAVGPDGTLYLADTFNHRIRAFDPATGRVRTIAGTGRAGFSGDGGPAVKAEFNQAYCSSLTPDGRALLVADIGNKRLRRIDLAGGIVSTIAGNGSSGRPIDGAKPLETPLSGPRAACAAADGTIYLALREGNAVVEIKDGLARTVVNASGRKGYGGDGGPARDALLAGPKYVSLDREGRVLIADTENHCIRRYDPATRSIDLVAGMPGKPGAAVGSDLLSTQLARPHGCCLDPAGRIVIADSDNDRILIGDVSARPLPKGHDYHELRDGLRNSRSAFERTGRGRVVFLGGSITAGGGWRDRVSRWLERRFPKTTFEFVNAGIGSLGSVPHAFRLERDVLAGGPVDLLFVEAAVNDTANGTDRERMLRAMEGIVRHVRKANPLTDVVQMHFVMPEHMKQFTEGTIPPAIEAHEKVAIAYGNPSLDLSREVTDRIAAGQFTWDGDFKNLHPSPFGHRLYAESIGRMLDAAWSGPAAPASPHPLPDRPIDPAAYASGRLVPVSQARSLAGFAVEPTWKPADGKGARAGFVDVPALVGTRPGDAFEFDFDGTAAGLFLTSGPDAGRIECSIDGGDFREIETFTQWSASLHLPWAVVLADGLPPGRHVARVRIAPGHDSRGTGTAVRVFHLLVN